MFNGEVLLFQVKDRNNQIEIVWEEARETWIPFIIEKIPARKLPLQKSRQRIEEDYR